MGVLGPLLAPLDEAVGVKYGPLSAPDDVPKLCNETLEPSLGGYGNSRGGGIGRILAPPSSSRLELISRIEAVSSLPQDNKYRRSGPELSPVYKFRHWDGDSPEDGMIAEHGNLHGDS